MGRPRYRSASGGSLTEVTRPSNPQRVAAAMELFDILIGLRNVHGKAFLHGNDDLGMAEALLERATRLDPSVLERLLLAQDVESGYTPLHCAMMERNLPVVLQILRHVMNHKADGQHGHRLAQRPMHLLQGDVVVNNVLLKQLVQAKDHEGLNPLDLLCQLQRTELTRCRQSLAAILPAGYSDARRQYVFEPDESMDNEFHVLQTAAVDSTLQDKSSTLSRDYGCEVLTFGRVNHCALGGGEKHANAASHQVRPQRVQAFGLADLGKDQSAIAVAAAAHHTLVATRKGRLYAFGLGKGGRLGTGDERHRPVPTRVMGPLARRRVVAVAAAENHSLCVTSDGSVYAWGSNRFGQLGSNIDDSKGIADSQRCLPRRVDNLKQVFCVSVAAGDRHSVALSNQGEVYTWGDNQAGQLGITLRGGGGNASMSSRGSPPTGGGQQVNRVDALWLVTPRRVTVAISAAAQSTLVLTCPSRAAAALPTNTVFSWGHGNHSPSKVNFSCKTNASGSSSLGESNLMGGKRHVNPVAIACAKYHNAAIAADGRVFTWGLHAEPLGTGHKAKQERSSRSMVIASPQVVTGMLPENGGGLAVAISACENHTAVLTDCGNLYTWGATYGQDVLGHEGVSWQPSPKKVPGVYRAVGVAAAKEHTVLLIGTSFPQMPAEPATCPCLETLAARSVAQHIDLFNAIPILIIAERTNCSFLIDYCQEFVRLNLDGILTLGKKSEMGRYLNDKLADGVYHMESYERDTSYHPLVVDIVGASETKTRSSEDVSDEHFCIESNKELLDRLPISLLSKHRATLDTGEHLAQARLVRSRRDRALSFSGENVNGSNTSQSDGFPSEAASDKEGAFKGCSERCLMLTANMHLTSAESTCSIYDCLSKEVRSVRKRLNQISTLEHTDNETMSLTPEQKEKLSRRPLLEADLAILEKSLTQVEDKMRSLSLTVETKSYAHVDAPEAAEVNPVVSKDCLEQKESEVVNADEIGKSHPPFRCEVCRISCTDANNFALHKNGRKHRNRVIQAEEEDRKETAAFMMETKRRQLLLAEPVRATPSPSPWKRKDPNLSVQPKFKLPPPPAFPSPEAKAQPHPHSVAKGIKSWNSPTFPPPKKKACAKKSSSFQTILEEEEKKALQGQTRTQSKKSPLVSSYSSPAARQPQPSSLATCSTPPTISLGRGLSDLSDSSSKNTYSLGDFLVSPSAARDTTTQTAAPWTAPPVKSESERPPSASAKSFLAIQQEEQDLRTNEDHSFGMDGHWYVAQRERAGSISRIQEEEAREREQMMLVEEQKRIEEEIMREREHEKKKARQEKNKRSRKNKKKQPTDSSKKQNASNGGSGESGKPKGASNGGRGGKEAAKRSGNRKKASTRKRSDKDKKSAVVPPNS